MKQIRVGIIGLGRIGQLHAANIKRYFSHRIHLTAVCDVRPDSACLAMHKTAKAYQEPQAIFADEDIDAVLICSPVASHVPLIIEAATFGKHIFCEKPLALDIAEINQANAAVEQAKVKLQIGFNRRFDPNFAKVQETVAKGEIGDVHMLRITSYDPEPPPLSYIAESKGIFYDMSIHDFDMARFLTNSEIVEVYARGAVLIDPEIGKQGDVDTAVIQLRFANGALGVIDNSRKAVYGYDQRVEVFGNKGNMEAENQTASNTVLSTKNGTFSDNPLYFFLERYSESYRAELQAFYESIVENKPSPINGHDGLCSVIIAQAAAESLQTGIPVKIA